MKPIGGLTQRRVIIFLWIIYSKSDPQTLSLLISTHWLVILMLMSHSSTKGRILLHEKIRLLRAINTENHHASSVINSVFIRRNPCLKLLKQGILNRHSYGGLLITLIAIQGFCQWLQVLSVEVLQTVFVNMKPIVCKSATPRDLLLSESLGLYLSNYRIIIRRFYSTYTDVKVAWPGPFQPACDHFCLNSVGFKRALLPIPSIFRRFYHNYCDGAVIGQDLSCI